MVAATCRGTPGWRWGEAVPLILVKALVALIPACMLFAGSVAVFWRGKTPGSVLQLLGAGCLVIVVLTHVAEGLQLFSSMQWGEAESVGHYLDVSSAVLGITLFPLGYLLHALGKRPSP